VRSRQLGFEAGVSFVRKTISSLAISQRYQPSSDPTATLFYTAPNPVHMMGVDGHVVIPLARLGERVQLGILAGGGIAWVPDTPIQLRIEGPPFFADTNSRAPLSSPPAAGGFVREYFDYGDPFPLVPGTQHAITQRTLWDISPNDTFWMLLRGQLAADFLVAPPLKIRVAGGFHYPGTQALGIDVVYLFRTGRVSPDTGPPIAAATATPSSQITDRLQPLAPRRSYWGVLGGATPKWWTPDSWGRLFGEDHPETVEGREFRIGLTRGRPLGYELGVSYVRKSFTRFLITRTGRPPVVAVPDATAQDPAAARITLSQIQPVQVPGVDFHVFVPIDRIGERVQMGGLLGLGGGRIPQTAILKRIDGPPFVATATSLNALRTLPPEGGVVLDDSGVPHPLAPGETSTTVLINASSISPTGSFMILARAQIAADVLVAAPFKLRFSGGFAYPGAQLFGIEAVYLFGTGRR
jgi:hypothetical protein